MTAQTDLDGGLTVGHVDHLAPVEAAAVLALRLWCDRRAAAGDAEVIGDQLPMLGQICDLITRFGRRPLLRHAVGCACVGADEACFARLVAAASEGRHEDALMIGVLIVRPDVAPLLVGLAGTLGHALRRVACARATGPSPHIAPQNLH